MPDARGEASDTPTAAPARRWTAERWARIGITLQFLALVLTLAGADRLRHAPSGGMEFVHIESKVTVIAAVLCWIAVTLYFFRRFRASVVVAVLTVGMLLAFELAVTGT